MSALLLVVAAVGVSIWIAREPAGGGRISPARSVEAAADSEAIAPPAPEPATAEVVPSVVRAVRTEPSEEPVGPATDTEEVVETARVRLVGRCVARGGPLVGAQVGGRYLAVGGTPVSEWVEVRTGADGSFDLALPAREEPHLAFSARAPGFATRGGTFSDVAPGATIDLGTLELVPGLTIEGVVTDRGGAPVPGATLVAEAAKDAIRPPANDTLREAPRVRSAASDVRGAYRLADVPAAEWRLTLSGAGIVGSHFATLDGRAGGALRQDFVVDVVAPIAGRVVTAAGAPIAGTKVQAFAPEGDAAASGEAVTDADGAFVLRRATESPFLLGGGGKPVPDGAEVEVRLTDWRYAGEPVPARWGDEGVTLTAEPRGVVRLRVVAGDTGQPLPRYAYRVTGAGPRLGKFVAVEADDGTTEITMRGDASTVSLTILPPNPYRCVGPLAFAVPDGATIVHEVRVPVAPVVRVQVLGPGDRPIAGAAVRIASTPAGVPMSRFERLVDARARTLDLGLERAWSWDAGTTDERGAVELRLPDLEGSDLWAVATPAGSEALHARRVGLGSGECTIVVAE